MLNANTASKKRAASKTDAASKHHPADVAAHVLHIMTTEQLQCFLEVLNKAEEKGEFVRLFF